MKTDIRTIIDLLAEDDFPFPVAIFPDHDCDLGPITSVNAFDVPAEAILDVSERITDFVNNGFPQPGLARFADRPVA